MDPDLQRRSIGCAVFVLVVIAIEFGGLFVLAAAALHKRP